MLTYGHGGEHNGEDTAASWPWYSAMDELLGQRPACLFALLLIHGRAQLYGCLVLPTKKCVFLTTGRGEQPGGFQEEEIHLGPCGRNDGEGGGLGN